ncbi:MAG: hypothetical protein Ct9H300mP12_14590 [Acidimicrobiales bacterium]|nr:MAG: hypothetical protein Ct9H300mP12_14590 [Acidimicrobiales bacterium]
MAAACVPSGEPVSWEDQADVTGEGLVEREFVAPLSGGQRRSGVGQGQKFCACVLDGIQAKVTFEKFRELDAFFDDQRTSSPGPCGFEHYGWFVEISDDCAA